MQVWQMRNYISDEYPSIGWKDRVQNMPDNQVIAIYHKIINRKAVKTEVSVAPVVKKEEYHQMNIFEYEETLHNKKTGNEMIPLGDLRDKIASLKETTTNDYKAFVGDSYCEGRGQVFSLNYIIGLLESLEKEYEETDA